MSRRSVHPNQTQWHHVMDQKSTQPRAASCCVSIVLACSHQYTTLVKHDPAKPLAAPMCFKIEHCRTFSLQRTMRYMPKKSMNCSSTIQSQKRSSHVSSTPSADIEPRYRRINPVWYLPVKRPCRPWSSVLLPGTLKQDTLRDVENFLSEKEVNWYAARGEQSGKTCPIVRRMLIRFQQVFPIDEGKYSY